MLYVIGLLHISWILWDEWMTQKKRRSYRNTSLKCIRNSHKWDPMHRKRILTPWITWTKADGFQWLGSIRWPHTVLASSARLRWRGHQTNIALCGHETFNCGVYEPKAAAAGRQSANTQPTNCYRWRHTTRNEGHIKNMANSQTSTPMHDGVACRFRAASTDAMHSASARRRLTMPRTWNARGKHVPRNKQIEARAVCMLLNS